MIKRLLLTIAAHIYISVVKFRHYLFNCGLLKSESFDIPIICVGNITVGGTGKTPMCEMLIEHFGATSPIALLSRGYGRNSRGYHEVLTTDNYKTSGDEPLQMKRKYPDTLVVVCEKRVEAVKRIMREHPEVTLIIMDDGFQHRHIKPKINIIMIDFTRPIYEDHPLPLGELRDSPDELHRADYFIVTKCPERLSELDRNTLIRNIDPNPHQTMLFTRIDSAPAIHLFGGDNNTIYPTEQSEVIALAGIGNPEPFIKTVESRYNMVKSMLYADHHKYTNRDISDIAKALNKSANTSLITTEKDGVKLLKMNNIPEIIKERTYYIPIKFNFITGSKEELLKKIDRDVK